MNLVELLWQRRNDSESSPALVFGAASETFRDVANSASKLGTYLRQREMKRVAIALPNSVESVHAIYGVLWAGCTATLVNHTGSRSELLAALSDADVELLITSDSSIESWGAIDLPVLAGDGLATVLADSDLENDDHPVEVDDSSAAVIIFTSGTTGRPKGAVLSHGALADANTAISKALVGKPGPFPIGDRPKSPTLLALPLAHTGGLCSLLFALHVGRPVVLVERFRLELVLAAIAEHGADTMIVTPTMLHALATHEDPIDLGPVKIVQSTGAPLPASVKERFEKRFGLPIIQNYGQTESLHVAGWTRDELKNGTWKAGSVGRAYEGVELHVLDDEGVEVAPSEIGEICVRSAHIMSRYVGKAAEPGRHVDDDGLLHTGDLGYVDADGFLFIVDRKREVMIVGGFNVYPAEVENALLSHLDVVEAVVIGMPDDRLGELPYGVVVVKNPDLTEADLIEHCREQIAHYKCVRVVKIVDQLPHTASQKIARSDVRESLLADTTPDTSSA